MGRLTSLTVRWRPLSFDLQGAFLHMYSWEDLLDFETEECVVFYLVSEQGSAPLCSRCYGVSVYRGWTPAAQSRAHLPPASEPLGRVEIVQPRVQKLRFWDFPGDPGLTSNVGVGVGVQSPVRELRSHTLSGQPVKEINLKTLDSKASQPHRMKSMRQALRDKI